MATTTTAIQFTLVLLDLNWIDFLLIYSLYNSTYAYTRILLLLKYSGSEWRMLHEGTPIASEWEILGYLYTTITYTAHTGQMLWSDHPQRIITRVWIRNDHEGVRQGSSEWERERERDSRQFNPLDRHKDRANANVE